MSYYSEHSDEYIDNTINIDMREFYPMILKHISVGGSILDVGFGSGRDSIYFKKHGYTVYAIDPCEEFVEHLKKYDLKHVFQKSVLEIDYVDKFDAVWASASLLHLNKDEMKEALIKLRNAVKTNGIIFVSFKYGTFEGLDELGRYVKYINDETLLDILSGTNLYFKDKRLVDDKTRKDLKWIDIVLKKEV